MDQAKSFEISKYEHQIFYEFKLKSNNIRYTAKIISILCFFPLIIIISTFNLDIRYILFGLIGIYLIYNYLAKIFENWIRKREMEYLSYYETLILELNILFAISPKYDDRNSLLFEILSQKPSISMNYSQIYNQLMAGINFEEVLKKFLFYSPHFNNYIQNLLSFNYSQDFLKFISNFNSKYEEEFKIFTNSLDTKLNILFFVSFFYPIGYLYLFAFKSLNLIEIFISILLFVIISEKFVKEFLENKMKFIGFFDLKDKNNKKKFTLFLKFFHRLIFELGYSAPDYALIKSLNSLSLDEKHQLNLTNVNLFTDFYSIDSFLDMLFQKMKIPQISFFLSIWKKIFSINSEKSIDLFSDISKLIQNHLDLAQQREIVFKSIIFKINVLKVILSFVLGCITPFILNFNIIFSQIDMDLMNINRTIPFSSIIFSFLISFLYLIISVSYMNRFDISHKKNMVNFFVLIIYIIGFVSFSQVFMLY